MTAFIYSPERQGDSSLEEDGSHLRWRLASWSETWFWDVQHKES